MNVNIILVENLKSIFFQKNIAYPTEGKNVISINHLIKREILTNPIYSEKIKSIGPLSNKIINDLVYEEILKNKSRDKFLIEYPRNSIQLNALLYKLLENRKVKLIHFLFLDCQINEAFLNIIKDKKAPQIKYSIVSEYELITELAQASSS